MYLYLYQCCVKKKEKTQQLGKVYIAQHKKRIYYISAYSGLGHGITSFFGS